MALDKEVFRRVRLKNAARAKKKLPIAILLTLSFLASAIYIIWNNKLPNFPVEAIGLALLTALTLCWSISLYVSAYPNLKEGDELIERMNRQFGGKE